MNNATIAYNGDKSLHIAKRTGARFSHCGVLVARHAEIPDQIAVCRALCYSCRVIADALAK